MYGGILGDIIGSPYEFDRSGKTKDFELKFDYRPFFGLWDDDLIKSYVSLKIFIYRIFK